MTCRFNSEDSVLVISTEVESGTLNQGGDHVKLKNLYVGILYSCSKETLPNRYYDVAIFQNKKSAI